MAQVDIKQHCFLLLLLLHPAWVCHIVLSCTIYTVYTKSEAEHSGYR